MQLGIWQLQWPGGGGLPAEKHPVVHVDAGLVRNSRPVPAADTLAAQKQTVHIRYGQHVSTHAHTKVYTGFQSCTRVQTPNAMALYRLPLGVSALVFYDIFFLLLSVSFSLSLFAAVDKVGLTCVAGLALSKQKLSFCIVSKIRSTRVQMQDFIASHNANVKVLRFQFYFQCIWIREGQQQLSCCFCHTRCWQCLGDDFKSV